MHIHTHAQTLQSRRTGWRGEKEGEERKKRAKNAEVTFGAEKDREE